MKQRLFNYILTTILILFCSLNASAQISGVVTDSLTNEPIMYVIVQYEGEGVGTVTNADGEYEVEVLPGWNELTFSSIGYKTKKINEGFVYYNQKNEGEEDYVVRRSYDYANEIADFFFFNFISDTYSIYTTQEHIIYSK